MKFSNVFKRQGAKLQSVFAAYYLTTECVARPLRQAQDRQRRKLELRTLNLRWRFRRRQGYGGHGWWAGCRLYHPAASTPLPWWELIKYYPVPKYSGSGFP